MSRGMMDDAFFVIDLVACIVVVFILGVFTIILKIFGTIDWAWLWVLSPIWIGFSLIVVDFGVLLLYLIIKSLRRDK